MGTCSPPAMMPALAVVPKLPAVEMPATRGVAESSCLPARCELRVLILIMFRV